MRAKGNVIPEYKHWPSKQFDVSRRRTALPAVQQRMVALRELAVQVARRVAGARDARDLQHAAAAQLVQRQRRLEVARPLPVVGLDAAHKVQLRPA